MTILDRLKTETQPWHDRVEELAGSDRIMDGTFTPDDYTTLIIRHSVLHGALEPRLESFFADHPVDGLDFAQRRKLPSLHRDIRELNIRLPDVHFVPETITDTLPKALGCMYVLEGSMLGGAVIRRHLEKNPRFAAVPAFHYLGFYGEKTGPLWKEFRVVVLKAIDTPAREREVLDAAIMTFSDVARCFTPGLWETSPAT